MKHIMVLCRRFMAMAIAGMSIIIFTACKRERQSLTAERNCYMTFDQAFTEQSSDMTFAQAGVFKTPKRADPSDFLIFPFNVMLTIPDSEPWGDFANMDEMMRDLYDCGFNTAAFIETKHLKHARNNNLKAILYDDRKPFPQHTDKAAKWIAEIMASVTDTLDRDAIHSIYLSDEPKTCDFPILKVWTDAIKEHKVLPYINIFSDHISKDIIPDYDEYLNQYIENCELPYFSYHFYPFKMVKVIDGGVTKVERVFYSKAFYSGLETIRDKSHAVGIPFWNVILSIAHLGYDETTEETLALQVYSALAYGSKGIGYFTFYTADKGNYRHGAIDRFGHHTKTWDLIRNINLQIHALMPVYKNLKSVNVFHSETVPRSGYAGDIAVYVDSVRAFSAISDNSPLLVGEFENIIDGKPYAIVVNKHLEHTTVIKFKFKGYESKKVIVVSQSNRSSRPFNGESTWLAPGHAFLLTVE